MDHPVWHKRLELSFGYVRKPVGIKTAVAQTVKQKFRRLKYQISRINSGKFSMLVDDVLETNLSDVAKRRSEAT